MIVALKYGARSDALLHEISDAVQALNEGGIRANSRAVAYVTGRAQSYCQGLLAAAVERGLLWPPRVTGGRGYVALVRHLKGCDCDDCAGRTHAS